MDKYKLYGEMVAAGFDDESAKRLVVLNALMSVFKDDEQAQACFALLHACLDDERFYSTPFDDENEPNNITILFEGLKG